MNCKSCDVLSEPEVPPTGRFRAGEEFMSIDPNSAPSAWDISTSRSVSKVCPVDLHSRLDIRENVESQEELIGQVSDLTG